MEPPSSLIFLVIIAIWAAYFIQYWVRRRGHLSTARSVDRFSESMRVLERRGMPEPDLSVPQPRSYAVSPARAVRPQVLVKRAEPAAGPENPQRTAAAAGPAPAPVRPGSGRRARGLSFLGSLVLLVAAIPLAVFALVPWYGVLLPAGALVVTYGWLRRGVAAERASRRVSAPSRRRRPAAAASAPAPVGAADAVSAEPVPNTQPAAARAAEPYDVRAVETASASAPGPGASAANAAPAAQQAPQRPRPLVDEDDIPLTWDPVPVPRPTYTMKAKASRPAPVPAELPGQQTEQAAYEQSQVPRAVGD